MTDHEHLIEQYNRSREALIRALDRTANPASREFLQQILERVEAKTAEALSTAASAVLSPPAIVRERRGGGAFAALRMVLMSGLRPARTIARR